MKLELLPSLLTRGALVVAVVCAGSAGMPRISAADEAELDSLVPPTAPFEDEAILPPEVEEESTLEPPPALDEPTGLLGLEPPSEADVESNGPRELLGLEPPSEAEVESNGTSQLSEALSDAPPLPGSEVEPLAPTEESEEVASRRTEKLVSEGRKLRYPQFQYVRPAWAVHLQGALSAFGSNPRISGRDSEEIRAAQLLFEWQPKLIQTFGILGLGVTLSSYPVTPEGTLTRDLLGIWSSGAQLRYQLRYLRNQWVVPYLGGGREYIRYSLKAGSRASGAVIGTNAFAGLMVLLNALEPQAAAEAYASNGILRTYLTAEYRSRSGASNDAVDLDSGSYYAGLRFEF